MNAVKLSLKGIVAKAVETSITNNYCLSKPERSAKNLCICLEF